MAARNDKAHVGVWHEGCSIAVWFIHRASRWRGIFFSFFFFLNGDKLLGTRLLCIPSQESVWLSLPPNAAILDKFMKKQMAATGALPAVLGLCAVFGWKKPGEVCETRPVRLFLSIILLSSSSNKKREQLLLFCGSAFVFMLSLLWQRKTFWRRFWGEKKAAC